MSIHVLEQGRLFCLHTKNTTYQMKADTYGYLLHTYYGKRIDDTDYSSQFLMLDRGFSGNPYKVGKFDRSYSLDTLPQEYPGFGTGDFRSTALMVRESTGNKTVELTFHTYEVMDGLYKIKGLPAAYSEDGEGETLVITLRDKVNGLKVLLYYGVLEEEDMIFRSVELWNEGSQKLWLEKAASMNLDLPFFDYDLISFYGRHNMERNVQRRQITYGQMSVGSTRGTSSHQQNPFVILAEEGATEEYGRCYGLAFLYSGSFLIEAEKDQTGLTRVNCGIHPDDFTWKLEVGESLELPQVMLTYCENGFTELSHHFHQTISEHIIRGKWKRRKCPILINNWEATYFDFDGEKLLQIANQANHLGINLFVLDDGWFGERDDDDCALGDWTANTEKLGCTLTELSNKLWKNHMRFGLWFEPEAISEDSDLYRKHPDWAVSAPDRDPALARNQLILDFTRKDVRKYIISSISEILSSKKIHYVKWDMNRSICDKFSNRLPKDRQGEFSHRYVLGLYEVLEKLTSKYPDVLFEGCSGGGGRFDAGMLFYTPQIWCSDNTDPINRLKIQYGTSFCYPPRTMGAHVSASPNHQTGRKTSLKTRAVVAMAGTFGYELNVLQLDEEEQSEIDRQTSFVKSFSDLLFQGKYYRLSSPEEVCTSWEFCDEEQKEALVFAVCYGIEANTRPYHVRVKGLAEDVLYKVIETGWNNEELDTDPIYLPGSVLMHAGLTFPVPKEDGDSFIFHIKAVSKE
ncbi:MAG: alpha-galactosidase [Lachnospiraceae bacterium]|nr:alpha-galactosidase [Lachnospiraceae bacterium]